MGTITWLIHSASPIARRAVTTYFQPLVGALKLHDENDSRKEQLEEAKKAKDKVILAISKAVCYNQGAFVQYYFLASERHRALKEFMQTSPLPRDRQTVKRLTSELINFLNTEFHRSAFANFDLIHSYFSGRHSTDPRICIKGAFRSEEKDTIVSVFRDRKVGYISDADVKANTGFYRIKSTGRYFIQNNIPEAACRGQYENPRLDVAKVKKYYSPSMFHGPRKSKLSADSWAACWKDSADGSPDTTSYYKSTLIIPMTLWNNKLADTFKSLIHVQDMERTIFGFLCFDHVEPNYFKEDEDVSVGYVFADLLSLYLFARAIYTEISRTFSEAERYLDNEHIDITLEKLELALEKWNVSAKLDDYFSSKPRKTANNMLFPVDDVLRDYVKTWDSTSSRRPSEKG